jgi:putative PIN family toxin of toxin-antitoxin system
VAIAVDTAFAGASVVLVCPMLIDELDAVLRRDKFRRYFPLEDVPEIIAWVLGASQMVEDPITIRAATRDTKDDYLVAFARSVDATIVTGDRDILDVRDDLRIDVLSAREYLLIARPR